MRIVLQEYALVRFEAYYKHKEMLTKDPVLSDGLGL